MLYNCDHCYKDFELRPGEGFLGSLDSNQRKCSLTLIALCNDCLSKVMENKRNTPMKNKNISTALENDDLVRDCIIELFSDRDDIALLEGVRDAVRYEDPRALGELLYSKAKQYVVNQIGKNNDS